MPKTKARQQVDRPTPQPSSKQTRHKNKKETVSPTTTGRGLVTGLSEKNGARRQDVVSLQKEESRTAATLEEKALMIRKAISLLSMLTESPAAIDLDAFGPLRQVGAETTGGSPLSFATEESLVEIFVFLISTTNDPRKVAAVCLEGRINAGVATHVLKIAANHGDLEQTKHSLDCLFADLRLDPAQNPPSDDKQFHHLTSKLEVVLHHILRLHCNRLLCRLRSRHARWTGKFKSSKMARPPVLEQMFDMLKEARSRTDPLSAAYSDVDLLEAHSTSLEGFPPFDVKHPPQSVLASLADIVKNVHRLWHQDVFRAKIYNQPFALPLEKMARYISASTFLIKSKDFQQVLDTLE